MRWPRRCPLKAWPVARRTHRANCGPVKCTVDRIIVKGKTEPVDVFKLDDDPEIIQWSREGFDAYTCQQWDAAIDA